MSSNLPSPFPPPLFVTKNQHLPATALCYGRFRSLDTQRCQIDASNDIEAVYLWLEEHQPPRFSPYTAANYRKEVERLYLWAQSKHKALSGLTRRDFGEYENFLSDPQPSAFWVAPPVRRSSDAWRPFAGPLQRSSIQQVFDVLRSLYSWLFEVGYMAVNPLAAKGKHLGRGKRGFSAQNEPFLDKETWSFLVEFIDNLPQDADLEQRDYHRTRWVFSLLYITSARRSEIANARMFDIFRNKAGYWLHVIGKGDKARDIPVTDELIDELKRYRLFLGLPPLPGALDDAPLVFDLWGKGPVTPKTIYNIVKGLFGRAAEAIEGTDPDRARKLKEASTHWLRHSSLSHLGDVADLRTLTKKAGHASLKVATIYQHAEQKELHDACSKLTVRRRTP